jgi:hypothetical protein
MWNEKPLTGCITPTQAQKLFGENFKDTILQFSMFLMLMK